MSEPHQTPGGSASWPDRSARADATSRPPATSLLSRLGRLRQGIADIPEAVTLVTFVAVFIFFSLANENFLTAYSLSNILTFGGISGIVAIGVAFLMISGEFDLSVGSTVGVASYVFVLTLLAGVPPLLAMLLTLAVCAVLGLINGLLVTHSTIPSFIITLGTLFAYRGLARFLGQGKPISYTPEQNPALFTILNGSLTPINDLFSPTGNFQASILWFFAVMVIMTYVLMRTRYGNWTYATGGHSAAAKSQGVDTRRVRIINFVLSGFLAGLVGVLTFAQRNSATPLSGSNMELVAVAAAVIGGVSLNGGYGTIIGASVGMLLMSMLEQGLALMGVPNEIFRAVTGAIVILSVVANTYLGREN